MKKKFTATMVFIIAMLVLGTSIYATPANALPPIPTREVISVCFVVEDVAEAEQEAPACPEPE